MPVEPPSVTAGPAVAAVAEHPPQTPWVRDRVAAVEAIWGFTEAGRHWLETYDLRQMVAQPTWFGSKGFQGWAGAGQAVPRLVMHELAHSSWGAFDVPGVAAEEWQRADDDAPSRAIALYRADLEAFMRQPPDRFEPLRDRMRNLPNLTAGDYPDLYHFGEADLVYMTGGDLDLIPPILRRYFAGLLDRTGAGGRDFTSWPDALEWYLGLRKDDRRATGEVFGLQHFPLARYESLKPSGTTEPPDGLLGVLASEEEQRLRDFANQFDEIKAAQFSLVGAAGVDRGFQFWRDYVRAMRDLHRRHPGFLASETTVRARELGSALDFYIEIEALDAPAQAKWVRARMGEPAVRDLVVLLDARALVALFAGTGPVAGDGLGNVLAGHAERLAQLVQTVDGIVAAGRSDAEAGAALFEEFVAALDDDGIRSTVNVVLDLLRQTDSETWARVMPAVGDRTLLRLLHVRPEAARAPEVAPARLLGALQITAGASPDVLASGVRTLFENSSGNFSIDRPVDEAVYDLLAAREKNEPGITMSVLREAGVRMREWLDARPQEAASALASDLAAAAGMLVALADARTTAAQALHRLIAVDPVMAADLLLEIELAGDDAVVTDTLNQLVYDAFWSDLKAGPTIDLRRDAAFLDRLLGVRGKGWLADQIARGIERYTEAVANGELEPEYRERHGDTLERLESLAERPPTRKLLAVLADTLRR